ncbi:MAG: restriction endonuclease subunit S [Vulcanimicrobiaceae bacterium]
MVKIGELFASKAPSIDPSRFPDETFELYSVPSFERGTPDIVTGREIGSSKQSVTSGDVLLSKIVPHIRRSWVVEKERGHRILASGEWLVFRSDRADPRYLRFALVSDRFHAQFMATVGGVGGSLLRAQRDQVAQIAVQLPSLDEQRGIADALCLLRHSIDLEVEVIRCAGLLKTASMRCVFTRGLRGEPQKETEIGLIPRSWTVSTLSELCSMQSGGTPPKGNPVLWKGPMPWVSAKDLKAVRLSDARDHITLEAADRYSKVAAADSVLVLVRGMGLANGFALALIDTPMAFNQDLKALTTRDRITGAFLMHTLTYASERMLKNVTNAAHGTKRLTQSDLDQFYIPVPEPIEQSQIVTILDMIDRTIDLHRRKKTVLEELFKTLLNRLMTGEISVSDLDFSAIEHAGKRERAPV